MSLALDGLCDLDCVVSTSPLVVDLPETERYVYGAQAVGYRVLYAWIAEGGLLDLDGHSIDPESDLVILRAHYRRLAEEADFVLSAKVETALDAGGALTITCTLRFVDGRTYVLEVTSSDAVSVTFEAV